MEITKKELLKIVANAIQELEFSEYEHEAILEYLGISENQYKFFKKLFI